MGNEALYYICRRFLGIERPTYPNLGHLSAQITASLTASSRFVGARSVEFLVVHTNPLPYPRTCFILPGYPPPFSAEKADHAQPSDIMMDNEALYDICCRTLVIVRLSCASLNHLLARIFSSLVGSWHFDGALDADITQFILNQLLNRPHVNRNVLCRIIHPMGHNSCKPCKIRCRCTLFIVLSDHFLSAVTA